jgi:hypothetical protein
MYVQFQRGVSRQRFVKVSNVNVHENPSGKNSADICEQTDRRMDRHYEANRRLPQLTRTRLKILSLMDDFVSPWYTKQ